MTCLSRYVPTLSRRLPQMAKHTLSVSPKCTILMSIFTSSPKHILKIRPRSTDDCKDRGIVRNRSKYTLSVYNYDFGGSTGTNICVMFAFVSTVLVGLNVCARPLRGSQDCKRVTGTLCRAADSVEWHTSEYLGGSTSGRVAIVHLRTHTYSRA